jgi:hypothetical protein
MNFPSGACIALVLPLLAACSTIVSGTTQEITFQSSPEDVIVTLLTLDTDDFTKEETTVTRALGKTPLTIEIDRGDGQTVTFSKPGYKPLQFNLTTEENPWIAGNILFGGLFGTTTDFASGAAYEYVPDKYFVTLMPEQATSIEAPTWRSGREKARAFIVYRHDALLRDLHQGEGEDLTTLLHLLHVPLHDGLNARGRLQTLSVTYSDPGAFANQVVDAFSTQLE